MSELDVAQTETVPRGLDQLEFPGFLDPLEVTPETNLAPSDWQAATTSFSIRAYKLSKSDAASPRWAKLSAKAGDYAVFDSTRSIKVLWGDGFVVKPKRFRAHAKLVQGRRDFFSSDEYTWTEEVQALKAKQPMVLNPKNGEAPIEVSTGDIIVRVRDGFPFNWTTQRDLENASFRWNE